MSAALVHTLYSEHHAWLGAWLRRRLSNPCDAADLAHDAFLRLLARRLDPSLLREPRAWLTTVAHGLVVDHVRRQALERAYLDALAHVPEALHPAPELRLQLMETLTRVDAMLDGLAPKARTAFLLSRLEGLSYPQIAAQLGVCLSSVEKYMATALRHCIAFRRQLANEG